MGLDTDGDAALGCRQRLPLLLPAYGAPPTWLGHLLFEAASGLLTASAI